MDQRGPAHQLAVRMRINNCTHGHNNSIIGPSNQPCTMHAPATARAPRVCTHFSEPSARMRSEGYSSRSVCLSVCLFVCLSASILALQATRRLMSDTSSFSATRAGK